MNKRSNKNIDNVVCPKCRHPGFYKTIEDDGRPGFICDKCQNHWSYGKDGGKYLGKEMGFKPKD